MLSGYSTTVKAYASDKESDGMPVCWECFVTRVGSIYAERFRMGLSAGLGDWERISRYEVDEKAVETGCEVAEDYHDCCTAADKCEAVSKPIEGTDEADWFCARCAHTCCFDCGRWLDTSPAEEKAIERQTVASGRHFW